MQKISMLLLVAISLWSCGNVVKDEGGNSKEKTEIKSETNLLSANLFENKIKSTEHAVVLDVRTPEEFKKGHLNAALNLDWKNAEFNEQLKAIDKNEPIFLYCLSGGRSAEAVSELKKQGFTNINELDGGILAWRAKDLPEVKMAQASKGMSLTDYNKLLDSDKLVLVDFYADWCAPCKKMKPYLDKIDENLKDKITLVRINVDENENLSKQLKVTGLPVLKLYKGNEIVWEHIGYVNEQQVLEQIK